jgi:hypothetical protein
MLAITPNSMKNRWDFTGGSEMCFSDENCESYKKAAAFLGADQPMEDWGCGTCWARRYFTNYKGIDGSPSQFISAKETVDLVNYTSNVDNILMRQVLEFNANWRQILTNVKKSFTKKFCLIICVPFAETETLSRTYPIYDKNGQLASASITVPEYNLKKQDILDFFLDCKVSEELIVTKQNWNQDWILYVEK